MRSLPIEEATCPVTKNLLSVAQCSGARQGVAARERAALVHPGVDGTQVVHAGVWIRPREPPRKKVVLDQLKLGQCEVQSTCRLHGWHVARGDFKADRCASRNARGSRHCARSPGGERDAPSDVRQQEKRSGPGYQRFRPSAELSVASAYDLEVYPNCAVAQGVEKANQSL